MSSAPTAKLTDVRCIIGDWYPDLQVDAEILRDGVLVELVVTNPATGTQALVRREEDLYRWFGTVEMSRPFAPPRQSERHRWGAEMKGDVVQRLLFL